MKYLLLFFVGCMLLACSQSTNNKQGSSKNDTTASKIDTTFNPNKPFVEATFVVGCDSEKGQVVSVKYQFFKRQCDNEINMTDVKQLMTNLMNASGTCEVIKKFEQEGVNLLNPDAIRVEHHTTGWRKVIEPCPEKISSGIKSSAEKAFPVALEYWKSLGLSVQNTGLYFVCKGSKEKQTLDTNKKFKVTLTGPQYSVNNVHFYWYLYNQLKGDGEDSIRLNTFGEAGDDVNFFRATDTSWTIESINQHDIVIDVVSPTKAEVFESIFYEIGHKIVGQRRIEKCLEDMNRHPQYNPEVIITQYTRYDEIATHYVGICLMQELIKNHQFPAKEITDPFVKYKGDESYRGIIPLLKKYPSSFENAKMVMRTFMNNPSDIDKLIVSEK